MNTSPCGYSQVGILDPSEPKVVVDTSDPYYDDPARHPGLKFHNTKPCNAELPPSLIMDNWVTPNSLHFIRHHHPVPHIDREEFRLSVGGKGVKPIVVTMEDLQHRFPKVSVTTTIQCGGNRREGLNKVLKTSGIGWGFGAISNAEYVNPS
jgi:sulfite oxidase